MQGKKNRKIEIERKRDKEVEKGRGKGDTQTGRKGGLSKRVRGGRDEEK